MASRPRPWRRPARRALLARLTAAIGAALLAAQAVPASGAALPATPAEISVEHTIEHMSTEELIGQLIWAPVFGTQADQQHADNTARYGVATPAEAVAKYHLGGVIYFGWADNIADPRQLAELSNGLQDAARGENGAGVPLAIGVDQEGGTVARIGEPATELPGGMALGAAGDPALARAQGAVLGEELAAMGIKVDFAPTVDLNTNPANPVISTRSMGEDPALVGQLGAAQLQGLWDGRVTGAAKHFPGHGDTDVDSHTGLPVVSYDRATLDEHLEPFAAVIDHGASIIMTAHIIVEAIDPELPATLSADVLTGLLREEMGYDGIITTDALDMDALTQLPGNPLDNAEIAALAIEAGADVLLMPPDVDAAIDGITRAMADGRISQERLEESVRRVLDWKKRTGLLESTGQVEAQLTDHVVGSDEHQATAAEVARRGTTLLRNDDDLLPLAPGTEIVIATTPTAEADDGTAQLSSQLTEGGLSVVDPGGSDRAARLTAATEVGLAVVEISSQSRDADLATAQELAARGVPTIAVLSTSPYDYAHLPREIPAALTTYGSGAVNRAAAAAVIAGEAAPGGWLPVTIVDGAGQVVAERGTGLRLGHEVAPPAPEFTDLDHREATVAIPDVAGVEYLVDGEPVAAGEHDFFSRAHVRARPTGRYWFDRGAVAQWHHEVDVAAPTGENQSNETASAAADDKANDSGQPGWLLPVVLIVGFTGISVIVVSIFALRRHRQHGET